MAISVTVTLLVSLMIGGFTAPASAQPPPPPGGGGPPPPEPLEWGKVDPGPPGDRGGYFWSADIEALGPMEKAIDGTIWLAVELSGGDAGYYLFKSEDFGRKWEETDWESDDEPITAIECSSTDADIVYVADDDMVVKKTTDGGDDWDNVGNPGDLTGTGITALSVAYKSNGEPHLFASTSGTGTGANSGDVFLLAEEADFAEWTSTDLLESTSHAGGDWDWASVWDVEAVYDGSDRFVLAVASADEAGGGLDGTFCTYKYGNGEWGSEEDAGDAELEYNIDVDTDTFGPILEAESAAVWLPEGFDSDPEEDMLFFVGLESDNNDEGDVYRVINDYAWDQDMDGDNSHVNVVDLDGSGDELMVALGYDYDDDDAYLVYRTEDAGDDWDEQDEAPTGDEPDNGYSALVVADDFADSEECLFATNGDDCAVSLSRDMGDTCDQISMIQANDGGGVFTYALDGDTTYMGIESTAGAGSYSIYRNDGSWERVTIANDNECSLHVSPDGDAVFYLNRDEDQVYRSTDGGTYFEDLPTALPGDVYSMAVVSKSQMFVGGDDVVYYTKNGGDTWKDYDEGLGGPGSDDVTNLVLSPDYDADETVMGIRGGKVFRSSDAGHEWKDVPGFGAGPGHTATCAAFHPDYADNGVIFAAGESAGNELLVCIMGAKPLEADISPVGVYATATGTAIGVGADGSLYLGVDGFEGMLRALDPLRDDPDEVVDEWQQIDYKFDDDGNLEGDTFNNPMTVVSGSNTIYCLAALVGGPSPSGLRRYIDSLSGKVMQTSPSDGSSTEKTDRVNLAWKDMDGAREYEVELDTDPEFKHNPAPYESDTTAETIMGLDDGETYYWRVRVIENTNKEDMYSNWSETWSFTVKLGAGEWNPFVGGVPEAPANGATNVPLDPTFAWNAADWATSYEFVLAKDAAFTDTVVSKTGANALSTTVYLVEQSLEYNTTYYWKVRGKSRTSASEWATAVFTTIGPPGAAPTAPPTQAPPPEPETPVYIWVIIGIGAALVIAVIVLIVRTRRVA
jgi:photosystem II stability/assembly factor-like uncharacterized protein